MSAPWSPKNTLKQDLKKGLKAENLRQRDFEKVFGILVKTGTYDNFDWVNEKGDIYVEHKERSIDFGRYGDLFFDRIKYDKYLELKEENPFVRAFIIWTCNGESYVWEFCDQFDEDDNASFYFSRKTMDRRRGHGFMPQELVNVWNEEITKLGEFVFKR